MSARPSASPLQVPTIAADETKIPSGQCLYILLNPEIKGQRCACVSFTLNRLVPGVACECGHLSCYHAQQTEHSPDTNGEVAQLKRRLQTLEEQLDQERNGGLGSTLSLIIQRLGGLEELVDKNRDDVGQEIKTSYRNVDRMWQELAKVQAQQTQHAARLISYDERLDGHDDKFQGLEDQIMELDDTAMGVEERIERLEGKGKPPTEPDVPEATTNIYAQRTEPLVSLQVAPVKDSRVLNDYTAKAVPGSDQTIVLKNTLQPPTGSWTVHVSLMPSSSPCSPFEKDSTEYKRCLSRGLHRMIAVRGSDSQAFTRAVQEAFGELLAGRAWRPLQVRTSGMGMSSGLPRLGSLDPSLERSDFSAEFLRRHCAVCNASGRMESLYIAPVSQKLSWRVLRQSPCVLDGLEGSWEYDVTLDYDDNDDNEPAGDQSHRSTREAATTLSPMKRPASEISRTSNLETAESEDSRGKIPRTMRVSVPIEVRQHVEV